MDMFIQICSICCKCIVSSGLLSEDLFFFSVKLREAVSYLNIASIVPFNSMQTSDQNSRYQKLKKKTKKNSNLVAF